MEIMKNLGRKPIKGAIDEISQNKLRIALIALGVGACIQAGKKIVDFVVDKSIYVFRDSITGSEIENKTISDNKIVINEEKSNGY